MGIRRFIPLAVIVLLVAGCGGPGSPGRQPSIAPPTTGLTSPQASVTPTPPATTNGPATEWRLRYVLLGHYTDFAYCDPDLYPVARVDEQPAADEWWAGVNRGAAETQAILAHHGYHEPLTSSQR